MNSKRTTIRGYPNLYAYTDKNGQVTYRVKMTVKGETYIETLPKEWDLERAKEFVANKRLELMKKAGRLNNEDAQRRMHFSDYIEKEYIPTYLKNKATKSWQKELGRVSKIKSVLGHLYVDQITTHDIEKFLVSLKEPQPGLKFGFQGRKNGYSNTTINRYRARLNSMMKKAVSWGYRIDNPVGDHIETYNERPENINRYLEPNELQELLNACDPDFKALVHFAASTGMRQGEILALEWHNVDNGLAFVTVEDSKTGDPREVPLNAEAKQALESLGIKKRGRVFPFDRFPRKRWDKVKVELGWDKTNNTRIKNWRFHDLRHHYASWLVMRDVSLFKVGTILGHKRLETTKRYAHLGEKSLQEAAETACLLTPRKPDLKVVSGRG